MSVMSEKADHLPRYVVIEGPIGVGKTTLAKKLAESFNYNTFLEAAEENPFLGRFYENQQGLALQTQLFFLFQRARQIEALKQNDLFEPVRVADFLIEKDRLFAEINLDDDEYQLYNQVFSHLSIEAPQPDLVIYLQAPVNVLQERIQRRGIPQERHITASYLQDINESYAKFFHYYDDAPLLIVNAAGIDFAHNEADYQRLLQAILTVKTGRQYFNPEPLHL